MKKTIKAIDLLNKYANGEEMPRRIIYGNEVLTLNEDNLYINEKTNNRLIDHMSPLFNDLNSTVEIIEEPEQNIDIQNIEEVPYLIRGLSSDAIGENIDVLTRKLNETIRCSK